MAECRDLESLFASYVDGEAQPGECAAVEAHLHECPACRARLADERDMRTVLLHRREQLRCCASPDLKRRCTATVKAGAVAPPAVSGRSFLARRSWIPLSMAATILIAVGIVFLYGLRGGGPALAAQLAVDHVKCFEFSSVPTILPDARAISREWEAQRGWAIKVPEGVATEELQLIGIRRCISTQGLTAHVMYRWHGQPLSVFVLNSESEHLSDKPHLVESFGQEAVMWTGHGRTYAVVARGRASDVEHVARYVRLSAE
jgi:anti-sigma factor RsiW